MITFRLIVVASALVSGSIAAADGLAAGRRPSSLAAASRPARSGEGTPAPRTCPERSWPYGAARCVAQSAPTGGIRLVALDAGLPHAVMPRSVSPRGAL